MTKNNFGHMGNQTHDLGNSCLATEVECPYYHYTKSLSLKVKFTGAQQLNAIICMCHELMILINRSTVVYEV